MVSPSGGEPEKPRHRRERLVPCDEKRIRRASARYPDRIANSERSGDRRSAVLADHSTDGFSCDGTGKVGNCSPTGPTVGKVKQGITCFWQELWKIHRDHKPYQHKARKLRSRPLAQPLEKQAQVRCWYASHRCCNCGCWPKQIPSWCSIV